MVKQILEKLEGIRLAQGPEVQFRWVPAHAKVEGNERANMLAKAATAEPRATPPANTTIIISYAVNEVKKLSRESWVKTYSAAMKGVNSQGT